MPLDMTLMTRLLPLSLLLIAGACSEAPSQQAEHAVVVVAGSNLAPPAFPAKVLAVPASAPAAVIPPNVPTKLMSVEQSAHIRTSEMWSEPITPAT